MVSKVTDPRLFKLDLQSMLLYIVTAIQNPSVKL
jgi:hypothetical protein